MPFGYSGGGGTLASSNPYGVPDTGDILNPWARNVLGLPQEGAAKPAAGTVPAATPVTYNPAVGGIPAVADPLAAILKAIQASTSNLPAIQNLSSQVAAYNQQAAIKQAQAASQAAMQNAMTNLPAYENYAQQIAQYNAKIAKEQAAAASAAAVANALQNLPATESLAGEMNAFQQAQALKQITDLYPQFTSNVAQMGANLADWASGNLSKSTTNAMTKAMMERGIAGGFGPDSGATNAALLALLGRTAEQQQASALTGQNTLLSAIPKTTPVDLTSWMVSPNTILGQMGSSAIPIGDFNVSPNTLLQTMGSPSLLTNYMVSPDAIYNAQQQANLYAAAPNPADAYNLAMSNALKGLGAGGRAGAGPYAGVPTTGGTSSPEILKMLQDLMQRPFSNTPTPSGGGEDTGPDYRSYPFLPGGPAGPPLNATTAASEDTAIFGSDEDFFNYLNYEGPYAGQWTAPVTGGGMTDEDWYALGGI